MSLEDVPSMLAEYVGINETTAQIILCVVVILTFVLPTMILSKGSKTVTIDLVMLFLAECLLIGLGWMPFWVLIGTIGMMAIAIATLGTSVVLGED